jgi:hypothetical protein
MFRRVTLMMEEEKDAADFGKKCLEVEHLGREYNLVYNPVDMNDLVCIVVHVAMMLVQMGLQDRLDFDQWEP